VVAVLRLVPAPSPRSFNPDGSWRILAAIFFSLEVWMSSRLTIMAEKEPSGSMDSASSSVIALTDANPRSRQASARV
jgi:hypothetical protein